MNMSMLQLHKLLFIVETSMLLMEVLIILAVELGHGLHHKAHQLSGFLFVF